jgi:TfoX/Sxy family transcriptional regulator of competence genes
MAFDEYLVDRVKQRFSKVGKVEEKKMMGGLIFMVNEKMCVGVDQDRKTQENRLMIRVGKLNYENLLQKKGCREMDFTGKAMKGFIFVYPEGFDSESELDFWITQGIKFNQELTK